MYLELDRLSKQFDGKYAVHDLSLGLEEGGLLCILGSSGCGKTTTLNMIGGFLKPDGGRVLLDRQDITALPPERRPVSTVFQSYGLFPHMSVMQNLTDAPMRPRLFPRGGKGKGPLVPESRRPCRSARTRASASSRAASRRAAHGARRPPRSSSSQALPA